MLDQSGGKSCISVEKEWSLEACKDLEARVMLLGWDVDRAGFLGKRRVGYRFGEVYFRVLRLKSDLLFSEI